VAKEAMRKKLEARQCMFQFSEAYVLASEEEAQESRNGAAAFDSDVPLAPVWNRRDLYLIDVKKLLQVLERTNKEWKTHLVDCITGLLLCLIQHE
jgi:hypothetical protein